MIRECNVCGCLIDHPVSFDALMPDCHECNEETKYDPVNAQAWGANNVGF